jgi:hypothetical protein
VKHELPGVGEVDLEDAALALAEHDGVRVLELLGRAGAVKPEELAVQVQRVDEVELRQVGEVDTHGLRAADPDRILRVVEREPVDGVEVVVPVTVGVVAVHDHDELLGRRPGFRRIDDEGAVEALVNVLLERCRVAVVKVHPVGASGELVREAFVLLDHFEDAVHVRRVNAVEVDRVRVRAGVHQVDAQKVVLGRPDDRPRNGAVVRPRVERHSLGDLDLLVGCDKGVFAHAARLVRQGLCREKKFVAVVGSTRRWHDVADHRGMPAGGMLMPEMRRLPVAGQEG